MSESIGHKCGVGVISPLEADATVNNVGLGVAIAKNLHHRGQCGYGFAGVDQGEFWTERAAEPIKSSAVVDSIASHRFATGLTLHTRYGTTDVNGLDGVHPVHVHDESPDADMQFSFNGNIADCAKAVAELRRMGYQDELRGDTEVLARFLQQTFKETGSWDAAIRALPAFFDGAYNGVFLLRNGQSYAFRDPLGFHPLVLSEVDGNAIVASEDAAIRDAINHGNGSYTIREIPPGHYVHLHPGHHPRVERFGTAEETESCLQSRAQCLFEHVYFADWESTFDGDPVSHARFQWGKTLAELDAGLSKDRIVVPIPFSANVSAMGYARQSGCSYVECIQKLRKGRTFIDSPEQRAKRADTDYAFKDYLKPGQKLVIVDDSIVRGNTMNGLIARVREHFRPSEIHLRVASPPVIAPCYYGIDMRSPGELIARSHFDRQKLRSSELPSQSLEGIAQELNVDSIRYVPLDSITRGMTHTRSELCLGCFTGTYPTADGQRLYDIAFDDWMKNGRKKT